MVLVSGTKRIKLEGSQITQFLVMTKRGVYLLLALNYLTLIFAVIFGIFEYQLRVVSVVHDGTKLDGPNNTIAAEEYDLGVMNRFLMVSTNISNVYYMGNNTEYCNFSVSIQGITGDLVDDVLLENYTLRVWEDFVFFVFSSFVALKGWGSG